MLRTLNASWWTHDSATRIVAELDALQLEVDALKRLQAETAAGLDALLPPSSTKLSEANYE